METFPTATPMQRTFLSWNFTSTFGSVMGFHRESMDNPRKYMKTHEKYTTTQTKTKKNRPNNNKT